MRQCNAEKVGRGGGYEYCLLDEHEGKHKWPTPKKGRVTTPCASLRAEVERLRERERVALWNVGKLLDYYGNHNPFDCPRGVTEGHYEDVPGIGGIKCGCGFAALRRSAGGWRSG
jgi:hypothetical protein